MFSKSTLSYPNFQPTNKAKQVTVFKADKWKVFAEQPVNALLFPSSDNIGFKNFNVVAKFYTMSLP